MPVFAIALLGMAFVMALNLYSVDRAINQEEPVHVYEEPTARESEMKFRKRPVVVEAVQYKGSNLVEIMEFIQPDASRPCPVNVGDKYIVIPTREGAMRADIGDWIIRGVIGEFYPCKPEVFIQTYDHFYEGDHNEKDNRAHEFNDTGNDGTS